MFFEDRKDAGERLVPFLEKYRGATDTMVLGLPRGGVVVALEISLALDLPLDVWVTKKLGAPLNPELAIGAIDSDGELLLDENTAKLYEVSDRYIREEVELQQQEVKRRYERYRGVSAAPDVSGKTVIVVDDGIATGYTIMAAIGSIKRNGSQRTVCAVPVASPRVISRLEQQVDEIHCFSTPSYFSAVGEFYRNFSQVSDEEVLDCLKRAKDRQK